MEKALRIWSGLFQASLYFDLNRMPELFCGFPQDAGEGPVLYPVACAPQAWSAASVFLLFQSILGLEINGPEAQIRLTRPTLPNSLGELRIHNLQVAGRKRRPRRRATRTRRQRQRAASRGRYRDPGSEMREGGRGKRPAFISWFSLRPCLCPPLCPLPSALCPPHSVLLQPVLFDLPIQRPLADAEELGRLFAFALGEIQGSLNVVFFDIN